MYANFTEEYATATPTTISLLGSTVNMIPFSRGFQDGALTKYIATNHTDAKAIGVGIYNAADNTITRNDTWSDNGLVTNSDPVDNIQLTGTVIVTCDVSSDFLDEFALSAVTAAEALVISNAAETANSIAALETLSETNESNLTAASLQINAEILARENAISGLESSTTLGISNNSGDISTLQASASSLESSTSLALAANATEMANIQASNDVAIQKSETALSLAQSTTAAIGTNAADLVSLEQSTTLATAANAADLVSLEQSTTAAIEANASQTDFTELEFLSLMAAVNSVKHITALQKITIEATAKRYM